MKKLSIILILVPVIIFTQEAMFDYHLSSRVANYNIEIKFEPERKLITGQETLIWKNLSEDYIVYLPFHLYQNAFKTHKSTFLQESGKEFAEFNKNYGYCEIKKVTYPDGRDLTENLYYIHPDDFNPDDKTVMALYLPDPIFPGETVELNIEFETKLPVLIRELHHRAGFLGDFFQVTQWFPKIGVYENGKWICHQYQLFGEFYADFGVYDVKITCPKDYTIGASGIIVSEDKLSDDRKKYHFYCEDVHDFAWSADKDFVEIEDKYEDTKIRLLLQPDHEKMKDRYVKAIKVTLEQYGKSYGEYPYPMITCIDAPTFAAVMEYPTLFVTGNFGLSNQLRYSSEPVPETDKFFEMVTVHEFGHNWWMGMVANNETEEMWLDESINSYATTKALEKVYGKYIYETPQGRKITLRDFERRGYSEKIKGVTVQPAWTFNSNVEMSSLCYGKGEIMLLTMDNYYGDEVWSRVMKTYFQRWKFKHPKTEDFLNVIYEITGKEFKEFYNEYLYTNHTLDFSIGEVTGHKAVIQKNGELNFPVEISFIFDDGSEIVKEWKADKNIINYAFEKNLAKVVIDPESIIEFELDKKNNVWEKQK